MGQKLSSSEYPSSEMPYSGATAAHGATAPSSTQSPGTTPTGSSSAGSTVQGLTDQAKHAAAEVAHGAREQAAARVETQKDRTVGGLATVANVLRTTSQQIRSQEQTSVPQ